MVASLAARGLRLRLDWEQCTDYNRTGVGNPEHLADTMAALKWLYDDTDFPSRSQLEKSQSQYKSHVADAVWCWFRHYSKQQFHKPTVPTNLMRFLPAKCQ